MKQSIKRLLSVTLALLLMLSSAAYAQDDTTGFDDVPDDHYAKESIDLMAAHGIIIGDGKGNFNPSEQVSKSAFAKMMVLTLGLDLEAPDTPYFTDVNKDNWAYKYVETAKYFMTFWTSGTVKRFKPDEKVVREDMAVAIVKAMGLSKDGADLTVLDDFADASSISNDLKPYVALAVSEGILKGSTNDAGQKIFMAQNTIDRAQTATMLARLIEEEKVTIDETKTTIDKEDEDTNDDGSKDEGDEVDKPTPDPISKDSIKLTYEMLENGIALDWNDVAHDFNYYKVVLSETVSEPKYDQDGYLDAIKHSDFTVMDGQDYHGNGPNYIEGGKTYYIGITVVYKDGSKGYSNVLHLKVPEVESVEKTAPTLTATKYDDYVKLSWTSVVGSIKYYKVVMSTSVSKPEYPTNGWLVYQSNTSYVVKDGQDYHSGDFNEVTSGETYNVTITAVYSDGTKKTSDPVIVTIP